MPRLNGTDEQRPKVADGTPFLATWLGNAGYYSVIVSGNDWLSDEWGNTQGYDEMIRPTGMADSVYDAGSKARMSPGGSCTRTEDRSFGHGRWPTR